MTSLLPIIVLSFGFLSNADAAACPAKTTPFAGPAGQCDCGTTMKCNPNEYCDSAGAGGAGTCSVDPFCPDDKKMQIAVASCKCKDQTCNQNQYCDITGTGACIPACPTDKITKQEDMH